MSSTNSFVLCLVLVIINIVFGDVANSDVFFKSGWYKTKVRSSKTLIRNVKSFDNATLFKTDYLKIKATVSLSTLPAGAIKNLPRLQRLYLTDSGVQGLKVGAFFNLPKLDRLSLKDNEIQHVPVGVFNHLPISILLLQRNEIRSIDSAAFDDMPNLYKIHLNANKIQTWDSEWFRNSPRVTELLIKRNRLNFIPENAFKNLHGSHIVNGAEVIDLKIFLSRNNISQVDPNALQGLTVFSQLWLSRNQLRELDDGLFKQVETLNVLSLARNHLKDLSETMFPSLKKKIQILELFGNRFSCVPYEIIELANVTDLENNPDLDCECVDDVIEQLRESQLNNEVSTDCAEEN